MHKAHAHGAVCGREWERGSGYRAAALFVVHWVDVVALRSGQASLLKRGLVHRCLEPAHTDSLAPHKLRCQRERNREHRPGPHSADDSSAEFKNGWGEPSREARQGPVLKAFSNKNQPTDDDTSAARACARAPDAGQHGDTGGTASQQCTVGV